MKSIEIELGMVPVDADDVEGLIRQDTTEPFPLDLILTDDRDVQLRVQWLTPLMHHKDAKHHAHRANLYD